MMRLQPTLVVALGLAAGCALKGDVRKVELQVEAARAERARADAERAAQIDSLRVLLAAVQQALTAQQAYLVQLRGDVRTDLLAVQQQLVQVQELTGQSQQRLRDRKSTRLNSSHGYISYAVFCLKKKMTAKKLAPPLPIGWF